MPFGQRVLFSRCSLRTLFQIFECNFKIPYSSSEENWLLNHQLFLKYIFNFMKQPKNLSGFDASNSFAREDVTFSQQVMELNIYSRCDVFYNHKPLQTTVHPASTTRFGKRAGALFTPRGTLSLVGTDRGRGLSSPLTTVTGGCHNTRHRVNDGHQTGLSWAAGKDKRGWRRVRRRCVLTLSLVWCLSHMGVQTHI